MRTLNCDKRDIALPVPDIRQKKTRETERVTMIYDKDVIEWFRATGRGYQTRINEVLRWYIGEVEKQDPPDQDKSR